MDPSDCDRLFTWAVDSLGGLDILINNTVGPDPGAVLELRDDQWRYAFDSIFMSALRLSRAAVPVMRESGGGSIVNLASLTAKQPIDGNPKQGPGSCPPVQAAKDPRRFRDEPELIAPD